MEGLSPFLFVKRVEFHVAQAEGQFNQWLIELVDWFFNFNFTSNVYELIYCDNKQQI